MVNPHRLPADISSTVQRALNEDIGIGDLTASLLPSDNIVEARIICQEEAVLCGQPWFDESFLQLDESVVINWQCQDADLLQADQTICTVTGPSRILLMGERTALNFLQLLSGTATITHQYATLIKDYEAQLLDTRKTIPGLRTAQKYAVACGGGKNHRMGLYDAILIKENHIRAAGGIGQAVALAKKLNHNIEVEVENLKELEEAITAGANTILLDNFSLEMMQKAVALTDGRAKLEGSGGVEWETIKQIAATGVDFISVGALTKNVRAIDYSMNIL